MIYLRRELPLLFHKQRPIDLNIFSADVGAVYLCRTWAQDTMIVLYVYLFTVCLCIIHLLSFDHQDDRQYRDRARGG
jgi:hypothetical protein